MLRHTPALLAACLAVALVAPTVASAKVKHVRHVHHYRHPAPVMVYDDERPPLTVNRRSWLDPGPVVPQGYMQRYVEASTSLNLTPDQMYTYKFGNETLPRRFQDPGRPQPLIEFWTPPVFGPWWPY